jgi:hypothetical protein
MTSWQIALWDEFRCRVPDAEAERWLESLNCGAVTDDELTAAVHWASQQRETDTRRNVDLHQVRIWLRWYRKRKAEASRGYSNDPQAISLDAARHALLSATPEDRWEIICAYHTKDSSASVLERFCEARKLEVLRPLWPPFDACLERAESCAESCRDCDMVSWVRLGE